MRQEFIKMWDRNPSKSYLFELGCSNFLLDTSPEARETKAKMNCWDFIKIKSFQTVKETTNKTKRKPMEREKIFANDVCDKGLVSKINKEPTKLNIQKPNNPVKKWEEDVNRHFSKKISRWLMETWKDAQHHSFSGKYKSKPWWNPISYLSGWLKLTTQETTGVGEDAEKGEPTYTVGGNANRYSHSGEQYRDSSKC